MIKNLTSNQILLIALATLLLLLAAFSFYLLQNPSAPLPFAPPLPTSTVTPLPPSPTFTIPPSSTSLPTRQTSYTPFASPATTVPGTTLEVSGTPATITPTPSQTTGKPSPTSTFNVTPSPATATVSPTASPTLAAGEYLVTGRVVQNGTPAPNVVVEFTDDDPARQDTTGSGGHYRFISLAPGTSFTLAFNQADNPQLTPVSEIASTAWIEGSLPIGTDVINIPDFELSLNIEGMAFELQAPADGAMYSAANISASAQLQFNWTLYNQGISYYLVLGKQGSEDAIWISDDTTTTSLMWNGTLDNGTHITAGTYWWQVAVKKSIGNYKLIAFIQEWDLIFTP